MTQQSQENTHPQTKKDKKSNNSNKTPTKQDHHSREGAPEGGAKLVIGPAMAIQISAMALGGSALIWRTPPKTKSVMLRNRNFN